MYCFLKGDHFKRCFGYCVHLGIQAPEVQIEAEYGDKMDALTVIVADSLIRQ